LYFLRSCRYLLLSMYFEQEETEITEEDWPLLFVVQFV
jgi:hypothetical protein